MSRQSAGNLVGAVERRLALLAASDVVSRIWDRDPSVWGGTADTPDLADRLGWLTACDTTLQQMDVLTALAAHGREEFERVVLLGMGGSSLAAEVLARCVGPADGYPRFEVLDSVHPGAVQVIGERTPPADTLYVVASKSGTTIETVHLFEYFWERTGRRGDHFVAITDPGTPLARLGAERGFRAVVPAPPDVGGRYSALTAFGILPAALMGLDVERLVNRGSAMATACRRPAGENPGARLGAMIAEAALAGRDKLTLSLDPSIRTFGLWMEQLVAESTGKEGVGVVPVPDEDLGHPPALLDDRLFLAMTLAGSRDSGSLLALRTIEEQGHPVHRIELNDRYDVATEFFRWEFAIAVAGHVLGVNPFDQPDVEGAKANTRALLAGPPAAARFAAPGDVEQLLDRVRPGEYLAILAYLPISSANDRRLTALQTTARNKVGAAVTVGYGPRYLHSTGQLHKGGPPIGHFILILDETRPRLPVSGAADKLLGLMRAQAWGDAQALAARGRPVVMVPSLDAVEAILR